jgi:hypothetical protein
VVGSSRSKRIQPFALLAGALLGASSCAGPPSPAPPALPAATVAARSTQGADAGASRAPARTGSCVLSAPKRTSTPWHEVGFADELHGMTWVVARASERRAVLLHLAESGQLSDIALPSWPAAVTEQGPELLRMLSVAPAPHWWTVDVSHPDSPTVESAADGPELPAPWPPTAFAADASRALVAIYAESAAGSGPGGRTALYEVPSGRRRSPVAPLLASAASCHAGRCVALVSPNAQPKTRQLVRIEDGGWSLLEGLGELPCEMVAPPVTWRRDSTWYVVWADPKILHAVAVDLEAATLQRDERALPVEGCPIMQLFPGIDRAGVLVSTSSPAGRTFFPVTASDSLRGLRIAEPEPLPVLPHHSLALARLETALAAVGYDSDQMLDGTGLRGPDGVQRELARWRFAGQAGLLRRSPDGSWALGEASPLPFDGQSGIGSPRVRAQPLTRGGYFGVLLTSSAQSFEPMDAWLLLRQPCPP